MKISKEDLQILDEILLYQNVKKDEVKKMEDFGKKYIDERISICNSCPSQIRYLHKQIFNWSVENDKELNERRNKTTNRKGTKKGKKKTKKQEK